MPVVDVRMFSGRDETVKGFVARGIADVIAETAKTSREGVHVIFSDVTHENWAVGPRLASARDIQPLSEEGPALVSVSRIRIRPDKHDEYLAWRRHSVYPYMASHDGFLGSTLLSSDEPDTYVIINKWRDSQAQEAYLANPRESELRVEAREFATSLAEESFSGDVVNVWGAPAPSQAAVTA